ncbi:hypothetical protein MHYP_G00332830 [Metynnis hypsauchen]
MLNNVFHIDVRGKEGFAYVLHILRLESTTNIFSMADQSTLKGLWMAAGAPGGLFARRGLRKGRHCRDQQAAMAAAVASVQLE